MKGIPSYYEMHNPWKGERLACSTHRRVVISPINVALQKEQLNKATHCHQPQHTPSIYFHIRMTQLQKNRNHYIRCNSVRYLHNTPHTVCASFVRCWDDVLFVKKVKSDSYKLPNTYSSASWWKDLLKLRSRMRICGVSSPHCLVILYVAYSSILHIIIKKNRRKYS